MSTEPGQDNDGAGAAGKGGDRKPGAKSGPAKPTGKSRGKPGKTVAAASAKSGRDETTVDIGTGATDPAGKGADETRSDLTQIDDASGKAADTPEIAPVRDTAEPPKPAARPAPPSGGAEGSPVGSVSGSGPAGWARPAEPSGSVSAGRTDTPGKPFNSAGGSGGSGGRGFAGTVLKDRPSTAMTPANAASKSAPGKPARKAQLQLARLEPWSVMKFSFVMSLVCFVVLLVAVVVLYVILSGLGVFDAISDTVNSLTKEQGETTGSVDAGSWFSFVRVFGYTVLVGALNVLLITALSTVGSVIYNLAADLVGGVEVTLKEAE
ncbi:hypothetical protein BKA00_005554 [Actinomadura coerulea]|uniref:DUF3566 domain-containing protein n=1 Tax=Actinomadura coerulea TaxID=46159 RepID=A0A7X0L1K9_9ACTN|nr:hypothetical protein [Actinomadura coerulea]GGQ00430.1 hypothetical protein GCM10010187_15250 [Actinomadura coerulea]